MTTAELDQLIARHQAALLQRDADLLIQMAERWQQVEQALQADIDALVADIQQRGWKTVSPSRLARLERYQALLQQTQAQIAVYAQATAPTLATAQTTYVQLALFNASEVLSIGAPGIAFNVLNVPAVEAAVGFAADGSPLARLLAESWPDAADGMTRELVTGIARGSNPRVIARQMQQASGASLSRCQTIARTETLRSYREGTRQAYQESGVVSAYERLESHDKRTCPACLAADGTLYALDQPFFDHPRGRGVLIPVIDGRRIPRETARAWFDRQPAAAQRAQLGPQRYELLQAGRVEFGQFAMVTDDPTWGKSLQVTPVRALQEAT
jgi:SPP1 gp7 family putative phage head morphogenesis protein